MSSFAAMPNPDPAAREARMQEALDHYYAKQGQTAEATTPQATTHHAKHHRRHAMKQAKRAASQDDNAKSKDQTQ
jgi:hypothetical protein